jgi:hypothetical protein
MRGGAITTTMPQPIEATGTKKQARTLRACLN